MPGSTSQKETRQRSYEFYFRNPTNPRASYFQQAAAQLPTRILVCVARLDHLEGFSTIYAAIRQMVEQLKVVFFDAYFHQDIRPAKRPLNDKVARYMFFCRQNVRGLPTFSTRPFSLSLPLSEKVWVNFWTKKEKKEVHKTLAKHRDHPILKRDLLIEIQKDLRAIGRKRTIPGISAKLKRWGIKYRRGNKSGIRLDDDTMIQEAAQRAVKRYPECGRGNPILVTAFKEEIRTAFLPRPPPVLSWQTVSGDCGYLQVARKAHGTSATTKIGSWIELQPPQDEVQGLYTYLHSEQVTTIKTKTQSGLTATAMTYMQSQGLNITESTLKRATGLNSGERAALRNLSWAELLKKVRATVKVASEYARQNADGVCVFRSFSDNRQMGPSEYEEFRRLMIECIVKGLGVLGIDPLKLQRTKKQIGKVWPASVFPVVAQELVRRIRQRFPGGYQPNDELDEEMLLATLKSATGTTTKANPWTPEGPFTGCFCDHVVAVLRSLLADQIDKGRLDPDDLDAHVNYLLVLPYSIHSPTAPQSNPSKKTREKRKREKGGLADLDKDEASLLADDVSMADTDSDQDPIRPDKRRAAQIAVPKVVKRAKKAMPKRNKAQDQAVVFSDGSDGEAAAAFASDVDLDDVASELSDPLSQQTAPSSSSAGSITPSSDSFASTPPSLTDDRVSVRPRLRQGVMVSYEEEEPLPEWVKKGKKSKAARDEDAEWDGQA